MAKKRVYVAFDYDDVEVKNEFVRQSKLPDCPFDLVDCSIEKPVNLRWPEEAERRIRTCDCVIVLCGAQSHQSGGSSTEVQIAQRVPCRYACLAATRVNTPTPPPHVPKGTPIYTWRWPTVAALVSGETPPANAIVRHAP